MLPTISATRPNPSPTNLALEDQLDSVYMEHATIVPVGSRLYFTDPIGDIGFEVLAGTSDPVEYIHGIGPVDYREFCASPRL